jgi:hypothetical protein
MRSELEEYPRRFSQAAKDAVAHILDSDYFLAGLTNFIEASTINGQCRLYLILILILANFDIFTPTDVVTFYKNGDPLVPGGTLYKFVLLFILNPR